MIPAPYIIMVRDRGRYRLRLLLIEAALQDILDYGIVDTRCRQDPVTCCLQPRSGIFFLQHQHAEAGFIILFHIDAVL